MGRLTTDWRGLSEMLGLRMGGTPLGAEVFRYALALLAVHMALALCICGAAWLTRRALALTVAVRTWLLPGWFAVAVSWLLVANATLFPWSKSGTPGVLIGVPLIGGARVFEFLSAAILVMLVTLACLAARRVGWFGAANRRVFVYAGVAAVSLAVLCLLWVTREPPTPPLNARPHIIVIGVDSLRADSVGAGREPGLTPNIDAFVMDGGQWFTDAITPLARTFPAWISILSGRYPTSTGARENLVAASSLQPFESVARIAQRNGYRAVFATDEVRFANIDQRYGFDQVITPTMGAADFLLGRFNDFPLTNLLANTWLGRALFPATYSNRAASVTYRPETFTRWLDTEIRAEGPTFLAVHLALPHHPYHWAEPDDRVFGRVSDYAYQYSNAVIAADRQFGAIIQSLERKGMLRNALVIVLSDHGEALGLPESDAMLRGSVARDMLDGQRTSLWGHGSSVLSVHQFTTVLSMREFGDLGLPSAFHEYDAPVSLVDLAPTIVDLLNLKTEAKFDGVSLAPLLKGDPGAPLRMSRRVRFTETGLRTAKMEGGDFNETSVLGDTARYFRMDPRTARFELRPEMMDYLLADKERAALSVDWLLAAVPSRTDRRTQKYVLVSRHGDPPRRIESAPPDDGSELSLLWRQLHAQYGAELLPPTPRPAVPTGDR